MRMVFLGPPGAGKGTQAALMAGRFGLRHASTGDIFRQAASEGSDLGLTVKEYLDSGRLVPDDLTSRVVEQMVVSKGDSYILDGYPRTLQQAQDLDAMLGRRGQKLDLVVSFSLDDAAAAERLTGRLVCSRCGANYHKVFMPPAAEGVCDRCGGGLKVRSDSSQAVVMQRLAEYHARTEPLVAFYRRRGLAEAVDASVAPEEVARRTEALLRRLAAG
jgi:adenylate kinase